MAATLEAFSEVLGLFPALSDMDARQVGELYRAYSKTAAENLAEPIDFLKYRFFELDGGARARYLTRRQYADLARRVNDPASARVLADKTQFLAVYRPYLGRCAFAAVPQARPSFDALIGRCSEVVLKPADGAYGKGIEFVRTPHGAGRDADALWERCLAEGLVVEEPIRQHAALARVHPASVNCVRVVTAIDGAGTVHVVSAVLRCGRGGMRTDSGGGLAAAIDLETGRARSAAVSHLGERFEGHPDTAVAFEGLAIPCWELLLDGAASAARVLPDLRLANWDWACSAQETWCLVEGNLDGGLGPCQEALGRGLAADVHAALGLDGAGGQKEKR